MCRDHSKIQSGYDQRQLIKGSREQCLNRPFPAFRWHFDENAVLCLDRSRSDTPFIGIMCLLSTKIGALGFWFSTSRALGAGFSC